MTVVDPTARRRGRHLGIAVLVGITVTACTVGTESSQPVELGCDEIAHEQADLVVEVVDAVAEEFASERGPSREPSRFTQESPTATAVAISLASDTPREDRVTTRAQQLTQAADDAGCDPDWMNEAVAERVEAETIQRLSDAADYPVGEDYVALNLLTFVRLHLLNELDTLD